MTAYEQGFMSKCAEYGIGPVAAGGLYKRAYWGGLFTLGLAGRGRQRETLREIHNKALREAYAGGYDQFLDPEYRDPNDMLGNGFGRWWNRLFRGDRGNRAVYQRKMDEAMDLARKRWHENYARLSPEAQKATLDAIKDRREAWSYSEMTPDAQKKFMEARQKAQEQAQTQGQAQTTGGVPAGYRPMSREEYILGEVANGRMHYPNIAHHYVDNHGRMYRDDGRPIAPQAQEWNDKFDHITLPSQQQQPKQEPPKPIAPFNPPQVGY